MERPSFVSVDRRCRPRQASVSRPPTSVLGLPTWDKVKVVPKTAVIRRGGGSAARVHADVNSEGGPSRAAFVRRIGHACAARPGRRTRRRAPNRKWLLDRGGSGWRIETVAVTCKPLSSVRNRN